MAGHRSCRRQNESTACGKKNHVYAGVYQRSKRDESGAIHYYGKFIPRFKPPREKLASGKTLKHDYLPLGGCDTARAAKTLRDIAASYYGKHSQVLDLGNGHFFSVPPMSEHEKQTLHGKEKVAWVSSKAKEVFAGFEKEKAARSLAFSHGATSSMSTGIEQQLAAAASHDNLQDSAFNLDILEDLQCDLGDGLRNVFDSPWEDSWSGIANWLCEGDSIKFLSTDDVEIDENPVLSPQQASAVLGSGDIISSTMEVVHGSNLQQLVNFLRQQLKESQRQLGQSQRELQREKETAKSRQQQSCFCQSHIVHP